MNKGNWINAADIEATLKPKELKLVLDAVTHEAATHAMYNALRMVEDYLQHGPDKALLNIVKVALDKAEKAGIC